MVACDACSHGHTEGGVRATSIDDRLLMVACDACSRTGNLNSNTNRRRACTHARPQVGVQSTRVGVRSIGVGLRSIGGGLRCKGEDYDL